MDEDCQYNCICNLAIAETMTTIDISTDIPSNINTLERLAAWSILALRRINPQLQVLETSQINPERAIQAVVLQAEDDTIRLFGRVSLKVDQAYAENDAKFWMNVLELSNVELPASFKS